MDRFAHVIERQVCGALAKALHCLRRPALRELLQGTDVEIAVVEERLEGGHQSREKTPVLTHTVAAHRRALRLDPLVQERQRVALRGRRIDAAREYPRPQTRAAMLIAVPLVHGGKHL